MSEHSLSSISVYEEVLKVRELAEQGKKSYIPIQLWRDERCPEVFIDDLHKEGGMENLLKVHKDAVEVLKEFFSKQTAISYKEAISNEEDGPERKDDYLKLLIEKNIIDKGYFD